MSDSLILVVEDEPKLASLLTDYLLQANYCSHWLDHGDRVMPWLAKHKPALVLLDIMLPGTDGLTLCRQIRKQSTIPIIMVTARIEEIDRLLGLEFGADDYICKPFSPREVVARVRAVLRRFSDLHPQNVPVALDEEKRQASIDGKPLKLTAVEFQLLQVMAENPGRIFSRSQLIDRIYDDHRIVNDRTIDSHIKKLRKKLAELSPGKDLVHSVYGAGYKLED